MARAPQTPEVRPLAPATVEQLRAAIFARPERRPNQNRRDATIVSTLAYAGLRPQELRGLRWRHVQERTLIVNAPKTGQRRSVRLLAALAGDLLEWRIASPYSQPDHPVYPGDDGGEWGADGFNHWAIRTFREALSLAGLPQARPYDLRHSFASLLLHEGRSPIYCARQLGHGADLTLKVYGHVITELEDAPGQSADDAISAARDASRTRLVPVAVQRLRCARPYLA
jgi:integrase